MTTALEIKITAANGDRRELQFNKQQVADALADGKKLDTIQPTDIGDIKFIDKSIDLQEILHIFDFVPGKVTYDDGYDSDAYVALDLENENAFDSDCWDEDLTRLASLEYTSRLIKVLKGEFVGWLALLPTSDDHVAPMFIAEDGPCFAQEIAHFSWFNDSTGAPVSWDGGSRLYKIGKAAFACAYFGDDQRDAIAFLNDGTSEGLVSAVVDYIEEEVPALEAILVLPAPVCTSLDESDSKIFDGWLYSLREEAGLGLYISAEEKLRVHQRLLDIVPRYLEIANFFESPRALEHARIWTAFEEFAEDGDIPSLISEIDHPSRNSVESVAAATGDDVMTVFENKVMAGRYGLADGKILSLRELAQSFGVSEERIQQIEAKNKAILEAKLKRRNEEQ